MFKFILNDPLLATLKKGLHPQLSYKIKEWHSNYWVWQLSKITTFCPLFVDLPGLRHWHLCIWKPPEHSGPVHHYPPPGDWKQEFGEWFSCLWSSLKPLGEMSSVSSGSAKPVTPKRHVVTRRVVKPSKKGDLWLLLLIVECHYVEVDV